MIDTSQYGLPISDANPFLHPQAVQRIIGSAMPAAHSPPNGSELGKASLLQMNELSRRAAANGGDGNLWSEMDFSAAGSGQERRQQTEQLVQGDESALEPKDGRHRGWVHTGWENINGAPSMSGADCNGFATKRSMSEDRERVGFNVSMARDDSSIGMRIGVPESLEGRRGRRGRWSDSNFLARDDMGGGVDRSDGYIEQSQQMPSSSSVSRTSPKLQTTVPDPWASLMSGQPVLMLDSLPQQGFNPTSNRGATTGEDDSPTHEGLQVYTMGGHLLPKGIGIGGSEDLQGWWALDSETGNQSGVVFGDVAGDGSGGQDQQQPEGYRRATQFNTPSTESEGSNEEEVVQPTPSNSLTTPATVRLSSSSSSGSGSRNLRVRRSTYVPGWAVPPRVLLVDDDAVSRKLSSKFLKVFGCTIDVAVDGVGAVNKMNLEKYDLVLMDIVMPKLDGVSATNLIRKFDQGTPIISMTSNSKPNEIIIRLE
jgi:CheY-like chemotaxis protein